MKYVKKLPSANPALSLQLTQMGWKKLKEPKSLGVAILLSLPFTFLLSGVVLWLAYLLKPQLFGFITSSSLKIAFTIDFKAVLLVIAMFAYMLLHELIHGVAIPNFAKSEKTVWGLNGLFGFVSSTEPIKKGRFILISLMPFLVLSIAALPLLHFLGLLNWYTLLLCLINAAGSCVDFLNIFIIAIQVPKGRFIVNNGFETFYSPTK